MRRTSILFAVAAVLFIGLLSAEGNEPASKERAPKTYTVSCTLTRKLLVNGGGDKPEVETFTNRMPDLTTLEGTRGEYLTGGRVLTGTPAGFQLQVEVRPAPGDKVRFEVSAEDSGLEGVKGGLILAHRQQVVRHVRLGQTIKLELYRNEGGEGTWVELTVREAAE